MRAKKGRELSFLAIFSHVRHSALISFPTILAIPSGTITIFSWHFLLLAFTGSPTTSVCGVASFRGSFRCHTHFTVTLQPDWRSSEAHTCCSAICCLRSSSARSCSVVLSMMLFPPTSNLLSIIWRRKEYQKGTSVLSRS